MWPSAPRGPRQRKLRVDEPRGALQFGALPLKKATLTETANENCLNTGLKKSSNDVSIASERREGHLKENANGAMMDETGDEATGPPEPPEA